MLYKTPVHKTSATVVDFVSTSATKIKLGSLEKLLFIIESSNFANGQRLQVQTYYTLVLVII